jgi:hypothetical protein
MTLGLDGSSRRAPSGSCDTLSTLRSIRSLLKRAAANFAADLDGLFRIVRRGLKKIRYRPHLIYGCRQAALTIVRPCLPSSYFAAGPALKPTVPGRRIATRFDVIFFSAWLSHVPMCRFERFWLLLRRLLAEDGRVLFIDEPIDVRDKEAYVPGTDEIVERRLNDGRAFRVVVKNFIDPHALQARLCRLVTFCGAVS